MKQVFWQGRPKCDVCRKNLESSQFIYDAKTIFGPWALMCEDCFKEQTNGKLGLGIGQKYKRQEDGRFLKVEG